MQEEASRPKSGGDAEEGEDGYDGKVRDDIDHRDYMPAAWRVRTEEATTSSRGWATRAPGAL